jgi:hypothetical protein
MQLLVQQADSTGAAVAVVARPLMALVTLVLEATELLES